MTTMPEPTYINSGDFFGNQGAYMEAAAKGRIIMVQRYGREHVVILSPEQFRALQEAARSRSGSDTEHDAA